MRANLRMRTKAVGLVAGAVAAMLALGACGGGGASNDAPDTGQTAGSDDAGGDAPTELRISVQREPAGFDVTNLTGGTDGFMWTALYDRLVTQGPDGRPAPSGAESWEFSEDGLTLTFHLRDDMVFTNGDPVTAAHAAATMDHLRNNPGPNQPAFANVASVEAPDDQTLVVHFSQPDVGFMAQLVVQTGAIGHMDYLDDPDQPTNPMGSGAYTLDTGASVPGSLWVLNRRDDHWNAANMPFETVKISLIADTTAATNALRAGEIDWYSVETGALDQFRTDDFTVTTVDGTALQTIRILDRDGSIVPALGDLRVRQAINYALNREAFVQAIGEGYGTPTTQMFFPGTEAYDESLDDLYQFDLDRARQLMAEAGYADGFDVTMPSTVYTSTMDPIIGQALAEIGINVTWQPVPPAETVSAVMGAFPMAMWPEGSATPTRTVQGNYLPTSFVNPFGVTDPELDALFETFNSTMDDDARELVARDINRFLVENAWDAPFLTITQHHVTRAGITYLGSSTRTHTSIDIFGVE